MAREGNAISLRAFLRGPGREIFGSYAGFLDEVRRRGFDDIVSMTEEGIMLRHPSSGASIRMVRTDSGMCYELSKVPRPLQVALDNVFCEKIMAQYFGPDTDKHPSVEYVA